MNLNERLDTALRKQICFMCLIPGHITRECTNPVKCQAKGCGQRHATMLHEADWEGLRRTSRERREAKAGSSPETEGYHGHHVVSSHHVMGSKVALPFTVSEGHQSRDRNVGQDLCIIGQRIQCIIVSR